MQIYGPLLSTVPFFTPLSSLFPRSFPKSLSIWIKLRSLFLCLSPSISLNRSDELDFRFQRTSSEHRDLKVRQAKHLLLHLPPSERTRDAVISRLIETLSPSILSRWVWWVLECGWLCWVWVDRSRLKDYGLMMVVSSKCLSLSMVDFVVDFVVVCVLLLSAPQGHTFLTICN